MILILYFIFFFLMIMSLKSRYYILFKALNSLTFIGIAVYASVISNHVSILYILLPGLIGCFIGDVILATHYENHFLHGLITFLLANLCFIWFFSHYKGLTIEEFLLPVFSMILLTVLSYLPHMDYGKLAIPVRIYTFVIAWVAAKSIVVYLAMPSTMFFSCMIGFLLYLLSDLILLFYKFYECSYKNQLKFINLFCYYSGLLMIAYSLM